MKTVTTLLLLFTAVVLTSCEGEMGPPGLSGESFLGTVFEIEDDFTPQNDYRLVFNYPGDFEVYDTDIVMVYMLWEVTDEGKDVWRLMPQTVVLKTIYEDEGWAETDVLQYNYDYTFDDVQIFLEGTVDFNQLLPDETDNQVFRVVVLPADVMALKSANINDFDALMKTPGLKIDSIQKIEMESIQK